MSRIAEVVGKFASTLVDRGLCAAHGCGPIGIRQSAQLRRPVPAECPVLDHRNIREAWVASTFGGTSLTEIVAGGDLIDCLAKPSADRFSPGSLTLGHLIEEVLRVVHLHKHTTVRCKAQRRVVRLLAVEEYLDLADIARAWGVHSGTVRRYFYEGRLPEPDAVVGTGSGKRFGWRPATVEAITRPGRGARSDLAGHDRTRD